MWFEYGKKAEGDARPDYWACDQVVEMYEQVLDLHEYLQEMEHNGNPSQYDALLVNLDHSQTHNAYAKDAVVMSNFNINWGGREGKEIPHDVTLKTADIGEGSTYSKGDTFSCAFNEH